MIMLKKQDFRKMSANVMGKCILSMQLFIQQ